MKKILSALAIFFLLTGFYSCTKEVDNDKELCNNSLKDGKETEIDCGGDCLPCPAPSTFSATLTGYNEQDVIFAVQNLTGSNAFGKILGPSIRVSSSLSTTPFQFMFIPGAIGEARYVSDIRFDFAGETYTIDDTAAAGYVTLTEQDTLRRIISGTFNFNAERVTKGMVKCQVREGVFTNVRYSDL
ncbi:MAG: DUF6252 family protein [Bacteroidota bacterium]